MMDGTYTAVVDRIVDAETAVILVEKDGEVNEQFDIAIENVPTAVDTGSVLEVMITDGEIVSMTHLEDETKARQQAMQNRFDELSERLSDS